MRYRPDVPDLEPTPCDVFHARRRMMKSVAAVSMLGGPCLGTACSSAARGADDSAKLTPPLEWPPDFEITKSAIKLPEGVGKLTERARAASHNNFYEFLPGRAGPVWKYADDFTVDPWTIEITGECRKPQKLGLEDLQKLEHQERLYHFRCVERWAMNVPWIGFPLRKLMERVEPTGHAKFVRFETANRPEQMPGIDASPGFEWPYHEALRLDEAVHDLTLVVTGVYGEPLLKQHGAPARIIVPWKYGYKSPKSIVKIELVREQPLTFWARPPYTHEYGFLSNVNPNVPHPRWSQARSYLLGVDSVGRGGFPTPIFNGYAGYVAGMYPDEPTTPQKPLTRGEVAR